MTEISRELEDMIRAADAVPEEEMTAVNAAFSEEAVVVNMAADAETAAALEENYEQESQEDASKKIASTFKASRRRPAGGVHQLRTASLIRPGDGLLAAFFVPVIIMIIIFAQRGIFPFGEESFLRTDMYHQYAPFFAEFREKITGGGSLLYSWNVGMGVNFSALYAYYLASPLNWLLFFCPKDLVIEFMTYSIVFKIGLSGLTFAWYLRKHCKTSDFGIGFFGIFYALSGYMAAYSWNIMWLDCILLFPVIMLGLERLVKDKKGLLYCVSLGLAILSNYYISIMICIFMVIYFIALLILKKRSSWKDYVGGCFRFGIYSLLAGGMAAVVIMPAIFALQSTASGDFNFPQTVTSYFSMFDMIARHIANVQTEIGLDHWPNIYCGTAVLLFFLLYLACRRISVKEKAVYCGLLLFLFASFSTNVLNFIWHGFHFPNSLPCRQSFIYIFLVLVVCYRAYCYLDSIPWKHVSLAFFGAAAFVIMAEKLVTEEHFHFVVFYVAIIYLAAYAGLIYLYKRQKVSLNVIVFLALGLVAVEAAVNTTVTSVTTTSRTAYMEDNKDVAALVDTLTPNESFYRMEKVNRKTKNDGAWLGFPSVSLFSSTANADLSAFFKKLGCESSTNAYSITGSTPLVDSLFSVKYGLYEEDQEENPRLTLLGTEGDTRLYENQDTLPLGFMIPMDLEDNWQTDLGNPAKVQNDLCEVLGAEPVLKEVQGTEEGDTFRFTPEADGEYYVYVSNKKVEKVTVTIGSETKTFDHINRGYLVELGWCEAGVEITVESETEKQAVKGEAYVFSPEGLHSVYEVLDQQPLLLTSWTDTVLEGTVAAEESGILFTSIPYDQGWTILVDGEERTARKAMDTFLAVDIPEGSHTIRLEYEPVGLKYGIWISAGSTALVLMLFAVSKYLERRKQL